jgi:hypothetical protein
MDPVLQAALQRAQTPNDALLYVLIVGLVGLGGLVTYAVKAMLPRIVSGFDRVVTAVECIPAAIKNIESTLVATEGRLGDRISALGTKIDDQRIEKMREDLRRFDGPGNGPPSTQVCKQGA